MARHPVPADLIDDLNRLMAEEAEACLRYFQMRFRVRGPGAAAAGRFFEEAIKETLEHADALARQIHALGHIPALRINLTLDGASMRSGEALAEALDVEQQALDAYQEFLPRVAGDPTLEKFIREQIATETEHVEEIKHVVRTAHSLKLVTPRTAGSPKTRRP
ncbi:MAG TPA: ferritin-like domain-containing protein [Vicinamibacterales bacterium]|nr:ferritin-like domain-containing protein [Vicinamibacterales bacterium]